MPRSERKQRGALFGYALLLIGVLALVEIAAWYATRVLSRNHLFSAPIETSGYAAYLRDRDPLLGWPAPKQFGAAGSEYDASGSRIVPAFPDPSAPACVALFGDSFTWGDEVPPEDAYGNVLAKQLRCRVVNYGVVGYGTDQAYLRYLERVAPSAPVVVLGHFSEDIIRNVNRYRGFIAPEGLSLKPRFILDPEGQLELVPLPQLSLEEYAEIGEHAPALLPHEYFTPRGPAGIVVRRPPYILAALRAFGHYRIRARIAGRPAYAEFYDPEHPSRALAVTLEILRSFVRTAEARGQKPVVVILPDYKDLLELQTRGKLWYAPLVEGLERHGIETPRLAERLLAHVGDGDVCSLFRTCPGHFNAEGYAYVANVVGEWIAERGMLSVIEPLRAAEAGDRPMDVGRF